MHRLFSALPVPDELIDQIALTQTGLTGAKWRHREHFHATLSFYGALSRDQAETVDAELARITSAPISMSLIGVGYFGRREPRAIYARLSPSPALESLAKACRKAGRIAKASPDEHPFIPHITLAYCKGVELSDVQAWAERFQILRSDPFMIDQFHLYESFLNPGRQSQYQIQADYPFM